MADVTPKSAIARAVAVLERAEHAVTTEHTERLVKVADAWLRLADSIVWQEHSETAVRPAPMPLVP